MSVDTLEQLIRQRNRERRTDGYMQLVLGILVTSVASGCILFCIVVAGFGLPLSCLATAIFLAAATWSAWNKVDPLQDVTVDDFAPRGPLLGRGMRGRTAAFAAAIISGPRLLLEGWRALRLVIPYDQEALVQIEDLLRRCHGEWIPVDQVGHDQAYAIARMIRLTKDAPGTDGAGDRLKLTDRGRAVLAP